MDVPTYQVSAIQVLGLACLGLVLGRGIRRVLPVFERLSIPASVTALRKALPAYSAALRSAI